MAQQLEYSVGDYVVYPAHGVGRIAGIETHTVGQMAVELYSITFEKERMTLKVPPSKSKKAGLRKLSSKDLIQSSMETLKRPEETRVVEGGVLQMQLRGC